jgi:hypothetical protein
VAVFNVQGARWDPVLRKRVISTATPAPIVASISPRDVEMCSLKGAGGPGWVVMCVVYETSPEKARVDIKLDVSTLQGWRGESSRRREGEEPSSRTGDIFVAGSWDGWQGKWKLQECGSEGGGAGGHALWGGELEGGSGGGRWRREMELDAGLEYKFKFVVGGEWLTSSSWLTYADVCYYTPDVC